MQKPPPARDPIPGLSEHDPPPDPGRGGPPVVVVVAVVVAVIVLVLLHLTGVVGPGAH
jgi:hypothetical protein